jgi:hypothetical protein
MTLLSLVYHKQTAVKRLAQCLLINGSGVDGHVLHNRLTFEGFYNHGGRCINRNPGLNTANSPTGNGFPCVIPVAKALSR